MLAAVFIAVPVALYQTFVEAEADRQALLGYSDGARYALSVGLSNPHLFRAVMGWAAGFIADQDAGAPEFKRLRAEGEQHPIEATGRELRKLMSWVKSADAILASEAQRRLLPDLRAVLAYHAYLTLGRLSGWLKGYPRLRRVVRWVLNGGR